MTGLRPTPRGIGVAAVAVVLLATGLALSNPVLRGVGGFAAAAVAVALVPSLVRLRPAVERDVHPTRLERGEHATARLVVRNDSGQRQPAFIAVDHVGGAAKEVEIPALPPGAASESYYDVPAVRRGRMDIGPLTVERTDPLGLARSRTDVGDVRSVWVHPRRHAVRVTGGGRLRHHHEGVVADHHPLRGSTDIRALREYVIGDELRHVHARASARTGQLVVRDYVDPVQPRCTVVLDNRPAVDADVFEEAVEVAASIVWSAATEGHRVRLCTAQCDSLDGGDRPATAEPLLDRLAGVELTAGASLAFALDAAAAGGRGGWLAVVSGGTDPEVLARLVGMRGFTPVTLFDLSGRSETLAAPGVVTVRGATARLAIDRWNGSGVS
jgi:uncharacterized protein (DUF58 family)